MRTQRRGPHSAPASQAMEVDAASADCVKLASTNNSEDVSLLADPNSADCTEPSAMETGTYRGLKALCERAGQEQRLQTGLDDLLVCLIESRGGDAVWSVAKQTHE